eukprot:2464698-Prymnesium_polylepis.1
MAPSAGRRWLRHTPTPRAPRARTTSSPSRSLASSIVCSRPSSTSAARWRRRWRQELLPRRRGAAPQAGRPAAAWHRLLLHAAGRGAGVAGRVRALNLPRDAEGRPRAQRGGGGVCEGQGQDG